MRSVLAALTLVASGGLVHAGVLQDFELGQGDWFADNGAWEVGTPSVGPPACYDGNQCAGTVLDGNYPGTSTRLVSPPVLLDQGSVLDPLLLRFWHWFQWSTFATPDRGVVQISVFDQGLSTWSDWTDVSSVFSGSSGAWTLNLVDLTAYAEQIVRIGFLHQGNLSSLSGAGWYVDDIEIPGTTPPPGVVTPWQDFEAGQGDWFADNGAWEVGTPSVGPPACYDGNQCAGTVLGGNYPGTSSRLISPSMLLGKGSVLEPLMLRFWHWFQWSTFATPDRGIVQISVFDQGLSTWSDWTDVSSVFSGSSGAWTLNLVDLTAYADEIVRIGFLHQGNFSSLSGAGWYVDQIGIQTGAGANDVIFSDSFESGQFR